MALKRFMEYGSMIPDDHIAVNSVGQISLSKDFCKKSKVSDFKYAVFYIDKERGLVGFEFTNKEDEKSKATICKNGKYGRFLNARTLLTSMNVEYSHSRRYKIYKEESIFVFKPITKGDRKAGK